MTTRPVAFLQPGFVVVVFHGPDNGFDGKGLTYMIYETRKFEKDISEEISDVVSKL